MSKLTCNPVAVNIEVKDCTESSTTHLDVTLCSGISLHTSPGFSLQCTASDKHLHIRLVLHPLVISCTYLLSGLDHVLT